MNDYQKLFILLSFSLLILFMPMSFASDLNCDNSSDPLSIGETEIIANDNTDSNKISSDIISNANNKKTNYYHDNENANKEKNNYYHDNENANKENSTISNTEITKDKIEPSSTYKSKILKDSGTAYFDANAENDGTGTESNPYKTLNGRLSGYTTYIFAPGTYTISSAPIFLLSSPDMALLGNDPSTTIIEYTGTGTFLNTSSELNITGLSLKNIHIESSGLLNARNVIFDGGEAPIEAEGNYYYGNSYGGAIKKTSTKGLFDEIFGVSPKGLFIDNCTFKNNHGAYGGAIYIYNDIGNITNTVFENNYAENGGGSVSAVNGVNLTIIGCEFNNDCSVYDGAGGVYLFNYSKALIINSKFNGNSAGLGGGITLLRSSVNISNSNFTNNNASYAGGAIYSMYGNLTIENSNFISNKAKYGGAIYADNLTNFIINRGRFDSNEAIGIGGAILSFVNNQSMIENIEYRNNKANDYPNLYKDEYLEIFIGNENYDLLVYNSSFNGILPSKFDLRDIGAVSGLKDQANSGNCWAFSTIAVLESCAMKASLIQENKLETNPTQNQENKIENQAKDPYNFSEGNLKNLAQNYSDFGWNYETNEGGFYQMSIGYLTSWLGPVNSSQDPTDDWDIIAPVLYSSIHVQNILYLTRSSYTDNDKIKEALMKYGAIATEIYMSNSYLQSNGNYYCDKDMDRNHAICVIGWDDGKSISGAPGPGAWIVKNSYGTKWGDNGYGYVSYYDHTLFKLNDKTHNSFTIIFNDTIRFNRNYQYDYAGFTDYFVTGQDTIYYANEFIAYDDDNLAAFSTYFNKTSDWEAKIYLNGTLKETKAGISQGGYYTFNLENPIPLKKGDRFRIEIMLHSSGQANFPISENTQYGSVRKHYKPGVSFFSFDGNEWNDLYNYSYSYGDGESPDSHIYYGQTACIKAFTTAMAQDPSNTRIEIEKINREGIIALVKSSAGIIQEGNLTFKINNQSQKIRIENGKALLNRTFIPGNYEILIVYEGDGIYNTSNLSFVYELKKEKLNLTVETSNIKIGENLTINISLWDENGNVVHLPADIKVSDENGHIIYENRLDDGNENLTIPSLTIGIYMIEVNSSCIYYESQREIRSISVENDNNKTNPNIEVIANNITSGEIARIVVVFDWEDSMIKLNINNREYISIIKNGYCIFNISNLKAGSYNYSVRYDGNEYFNEAIIKGNLLVFKNGNETTMNTYIIIEELVKYYGGSQNLNIRLFDDSNNPLPNQKLTVEINSTSDSSKNRLYSYDTDENGTVTINIDQDIGEFDIFVRFDGNDEYEASNESSKIIIKDTFDLRDLNESYGTVSPVYVYAHDKEGNPLKDIRIRFKIANGWYSRKTNEEGMAKFNIYLNPGEYIIIAENSLTNEIREGYVKVNENNLNSNELLLEIFSCDIIFENKYNETSDFLDNNINLDEKNNRSEEFDRKTKMTEHSSAKREIKTSNVKTEPNKKPKETQTNKKPNEINIKKLIKSSFIKKIKRGLDQSPNNLFRAYETNHIPNLNIDLINKSTINPIKTEENVFIRNTKSVLESMIDKNKSNLIGIITSLVKICYTSLLEICF